jgi:hypothetical protein
MKKKIKETKYEKYQRLLGVDKTKLCDRCGNDLGYGSGCIHLPFIKKYISLCGICQKGLIFGYYIDFKNTIKEDKNE